MYLNDLVAAGGLMVFGIGLRILEIKDTKGGELLTGTFGFPDTYVSNNAL